MKSNTRLAAAIALAGLLFFGVLILRQAQDVALAQTDGRDAPAQYIVETKTVSGGGYYLTGLSWQVSGSAEGGRYRLLEPAAPALRGSGCCCVYLPLAVRSFP